MIEPKVYTSTDGTISGTVKELAKTYGICDTVIYRRLAAGEPLEKAIQRRDHTVRITIDGVTDNLLNTLDRCDIRTWIYYTVRDQHPDLTPQERVEYILEQRQNGKPVVEQNRKVKRYVYNGEEGTVFELARKYSKLDPKIVHCRVSRGWNIDRALNAPVRDTADKMYYFKGNVEPLGTLIDKYAAVSRSQVYRRLRNGWPLDEAILRPRTQH